MVANNEWEHVVSMLYARSFAAPIADSDVCQVDGQMVLNGMFGVEKPDKPPTSRGPALRLIMNFVPEEWRVWQWPTRRFSGLLGTGPRMHY